MKNIKMSLLIASLSLVARLAVPAQGNDWNDERNSNTGSGAGPAWEMSILGGGALPVGDGDPYGFGGEYKSSGLLQASLIRSLSPDIGLGLETGYSFGHEYDMRFGRYSQYLFNPKLTSQITQLTPVLELGRWFGAVKPYMILGGGLYHVSSTFSLEDPYYGRISDTESSDYAGINVGVGMLARIGNQVAIGPDVRYHRILSDVFEFHYVTATARLAFLF